ncbi:MAG: CPXCG motif-containing cysteine-rich protein [Bacteroidetes bacterium]|nr:CPXCG motif-containing cysteine-rich protein [Bacteroidota bacterium]
MHEHGFTCPHCWESITMLLDLSVREQTYVEDCEVCCRPIRIHYAAERGALTTFEATPAQ